MAVLELDLTRSTGIVIIRIAGSVISDHETDTVAAAFEFVPEDEHLVQPDQRSATDSALCV